MATRSNRPNRPNRKRESGPRARPAKEQARGASGPLGGLLRAHRDAFGDSVSRLVREPFDSAMTVFVIAVALLLPGLFSMLATNLGALGERFEESARITLFLAEEVGELDALQLRDALLADPGVVSVDYISRAAALAEFQSRSDIAAVLGELGESPLPASLVIRPVALDPAGVQALIQRFEERTEIETLSVDLLWIQRLNGMGTLLERSGLVLSLILGLAVLLLVGNSIRTAFEGRQREVEVIRLVGGTSAYIARPFLYGGLLLGLLGAAIAVALIVLIQEAVRPAIDNLLSLYGSRTQLQFFSSLEALHLVLLGSILGWLGAAISIAVRLYRSPP